LFGLKRITFFFLHIEADFSLWLLVAVYLQSGWNGEFSAACSCDNYCSIGLKLTHLQLDVLSFGDWSEFLVLGSVLP